MTNRLTVLGLVGVVMALVPATEAAAVPPANDNYLSATQINTRGTQLQRTTYQRFLSTVEATVQADLFNPPSSGGPAEPRRCPAIVSPAATVGKTVWYDIYPDVDGLVTVQAGGFDAVIGIVPFSPPPAAATPNLAEYRCMDDPQSLAVRVRGGQPYSIQVGGWSPDATNANAASGTLGFTLDFLPDTDSDGVLDRDDACPTEAGLVKFAGCPDPDPDADGVVAPNDRCPTTPGTVNGCPDADGDGIADIDDRCPSEDARARDADRNGCLDPLPPIGPVRLDQLVDSKLTFDRLPGFGIKVRSLKVTRVPAGARVDFSCAAPPGRSAHRSCTVSARIAGARARAAKTLAYLGRGVRLRSGTVIEIRATASGAIGKYIRYKINKRSGFTRTSGCMNQGQSAPRKARTCA